ncbi:MAG: phosphatidylglycerophosphatase A [Myxococcota bacterium]
MPSAEGMGWAAWIATAGGLGLSPIAPGTMGSLGAVMLFGGTFSFFARPGLTHSLETGDLGFDLTAYALTYALIYAVATLGLIVIGVWSADRVERVWKRHDDNRIVIDEVVGQLIALSPLIWFFSGPSQAGSTEKSSIFFGVVTGFVLFRLFDVWKPGAIRWAERRFQGGMGVMADDVVAGVYSAILLSLILNFGPTVLKGLA